MQLLVNEYARSYIRRLTCSCSHWA